MISFLAGGGCKNENDGQTKPLPKSFGEIVPYWYLKNDDVTNLS